MLSPETLTVTLELPALRDLNWAMELEAPANTVAPEPTLVAPTSIPERVSPIVISLAPSVSVMRPDAVKLLNWNCVPTVVL